MLGLAAAKLAEEYTMNPMNLSMLAEVWNGLDDDAKQNSNFATLYEIKQHLIASTRKSQLRRRSKIQARNRESL